ncbi:MAG: NosD domain-containing protein, partial [Myxococcota bacterium]|nr:NosD domain-containing protein [Myxococcota bacterium]
MMRVLVVIAAVSLGGCEREPSHLDQDADAVVSTAIDSRGGTVSLGRVTLEIPEGALDGPTTITVRQLDHPAWAAVGPAYELGPDGLAFRRPARLSVSYDGIEMPPGTDPGSLRLSVLDRDRWVALADQQNDSDALRVSGTLEHFSIYGLVPEPRIAAGIGTRLEANGITVEATASVYGRLVVSAYSLSLYVERDATDAVSVTFTGPPTDAENYAYVRSYAEERVLTPADGGTMTFSLDLREPAIIWFQPVPGTTFIGGAGDECVPPVGVRVGDVCRLTSDVIGSVELVAGTLDCDGHAIRQALTDRGMGTGIFVGPNATTPVIRNCTIGGTDAQFGNGIVAFRTDGLMATDNRLEDNTVGIVLQSATSSNVARNTVTGPSYWAITLWDRAAGNEVAQNSIAVGYDGVTLDGLVNDPTANTANRVIGNTIVGGTGGVLLAHAQGNELTGNNREGGVNGITATGDAWPNRVYWNNFSGWSHWGVWMDAGPAAELSDGGRGNWWGRSCPGPLFLPGVDSNRADVVDSFAYGARDLWLSGAGPGCAPPDTTPPEPPIIRLPAENDVVYSATPAFIGTAEPNAVVVVYEGSLPLGTAVATADGDFGVAPTSPLPSGSHAVYATATDNAANTSDPSATRVFTIRPVSTTSPLVGAAGKIEVVALTDVPDVFEPASEQNHVRVEARVAPVSGLGGSSRNHRFLALAERTIRDATTGVAVKTTLGFTEIANLPGAGGDWIPVTVADYWCGTDDGGNPVARGSTYNYDLSVKLLRQYVGSGSGPRCSRGEAVVAAGPGSSACVVD